jgi:signal transduction histidine kinase
LRKSEKIILIYILLNTIILLAAGMYLLSRVVIRPIQKLLKVTEEFKEDEPLALPPEPSANEIGQLFHSLRIMLTRLEENKRELKAHIASLKQANQELQKTQEEVIRSEKLASVGRLAAGVAHEVGNPIGVVLDYLDMMKNGELSGPEVKDALDRCESEIARINKIIRQLLDYSRPSPYESKHISVHGLLSESIEMLQPQPLMRGIKVDMNLVSPQDIVMGDENRLKQVFINILLNAADAIKEKQKSGRTNEDEKIVITTRNSHGTIKISFQDTGCGIPGESIKRIFDPFYSTKEPGKGTGLGLSVSYRIVEQMGGTMRAESNEGQGATIHVILPLADAEK